MRCVCLPLLFIFPHRGKWGGWWFCTWALALPLPSFTPPPPSPFQRPPFRYCMAMTFLYLFTSILLTGLVGSQLLSHRIFCFYPVSHTFSTMPTTFMLIEGCSILILLAIWAQTEDRLWLGFCVTIRLGGGTHFIWGSWLGWSFPWRKDFLLCFLSGLRFCWRSRFACNVGCLFFSAWIRR